MDIKQALRFFKFIPQEEQENFINAFDGTEKEEKTETKIEEPKSEEKTEVEALKEQIESLKSLLTSKKEKEEGTQEKEEPSLRELIERGEL